MKALEASFDWGRLWVAAACVASLHGASPTPVHADTDVPVGAFRSVAARNGAHVTLRHGETPRVTLIRGSLDDSQIRVDDEGRLVIDRCAAGCPRAYKLEVEVVTPRIGALSVADGGWLRCAGSFPRQASLAAAVESGGTLDVRSMKVDDVSAAIQHGGRILTEPRASLTAAIAEGGAVVYWGRPEVQRSIVHGGVVVRGRAADRERPLQEIGTAAGQ
jgi:hypothetical protein